MGGLVFTSDDISSYTDVQLRQYLSQFPFSVKSVEDATPFGEAWRLTLSSQGATYVVAANLGSRSATIDLDPGVYYCDGHLIDGRVPLQLLPFDSVCLRKAHGDNVELLGTTTHLFPGLDIRHFDCHDTSIVLQRFNTAQLEGEALIGVPNASDRWTVNGVSATPEQEGGLTVLRLPLERVALPVD